MRPRIGKRSVGCLPTRFTDDIVTYCGCGFTAGRPLSNEAACGLWKRLMSKNGISTGDIIDNDDHDD